MKYVVALLVTALSFCLIAVASVLFLAPAPIRAEYWVGQMMVIKRHIGESYAASRKIIVASGSNSLFNIDAKRASAALGMPVINDGLHKNLPLAQILETASAAARRNDVVVLPLEAKLYCEQGITEWQLRNAIAWNHPVWRALDMHERLRLAARSGPTLPFEVLMARLLEATHGRSIRQRLDALDPGLTLRQFARASIPTRFAYSAFNLDGLGDMQATDGANFVGIPTSAASDTVLCDSSLSRLREFVAAMAQEGVQVLFANTPYVDVPGLDRNAVKTSAAKFNAAIGRIAPVIDSKADLLFDRSLFFNTDLHLNSRGRAIRTQMFIDAMKSRLSP